VLDAQRKWVVGDARLDSNAPQRAIVVDGETVGWLVGDPGKPPLGGADVRFLQEQLKASWIISGVAVVLAAAVALWLARRLLAPVKQLAAATHQLAAGDYATRVKSSSRDELGQLVDDFNRLATTLESTDQMRRSFLAEISHELRTPLTVLQGELEALEDGIRPLTAASVKSLQVEVGTLSVLVRDLYDLSLADVGALSYRFDEVNLVELLQAAVDAFRERLALRRLAVETQWKGDEGVLLEGDPDRLRQLLNNLLENSVRYTYPHGRLRIALRRVDDEAQLDFQDSAPAVPPEFLPRVFERLFRIEPSRSRASGGAGLGLALCRSIVEAHHGRIEARSSPLGGLWVHVVLPVVRGTKR
jgi:two-component system sensor histidine kinase BaeS